MVIFLPTVTCVWLLMEPCLSSDVNIPFVINTWAFVNGTQKAWEVVYHERRSALDAVEEGCSTCEAEQCDYTVGYGGSPDENGETTLDAMIMDGRTHDVGAVAALRRVKSAISVARRVLENTDHTLLVGDQATSFALNMGFKEENLSTPYSQKLWTTWKLNKCQPNFWKKVLPDPKSSCGPYIPTAHSNSPETPNNSRCSPCFDAHSHDTIGMIVIDNKNNIAAGTSSNGAKFKIPGRVGDSPIPGAGAYVDQDVGGAAATGDGDVMMRFLPSYHTVENMRNGMNPAAATKDSIQRIIRKYPGFVGAVVAANIKGEFGAACHGIEEFPFSIANAVYKQAVVKTVPCISLQKF